MSLYGITGLAIGYGVGILWFVLPLAVFMRRDLRRRWLWALGVLAFPFAYLAAIQVGRLRGPGWRGWAVRIFVAGAVAIGFIWLGGSQWVNTPESFEFRGHLVSLFTSEIASVEGRLVRTFNAGEFETAESADVFPAAFAIASLAVLAGAMQFYGPIVKSIVFALLFTSCSFVTTLVTEAWLIDAFASEQAGNEQADVGDYRQFYRFHLWYLVMFGVAVFWARSDIRNETNAADAIDEHAPTDSTP